MMNMHRLLITLLSLSFALVAQGCLSIGVYRTAEILPEGEGDFTMTFSATRYQGQETTNSQVDPETNEATTETVQNENVVLPNLLPEFAYHIGVAEDLEVGGRIVVLGGLLELDMKYRFLGKTGDDLQMAIQPALGYRALFNIEGISASLPVITTYKVNDTISLNFAPYLSYTDFLSTDSAFDFLGGSWLSAGGSLGFKITGQTMYFMPQIEISKNLENLQETSSSSDSSSAIAMFGITIGFIEGKEMTKLKEMDEKLDKLINK